MREASRPRRARKRLLAAGLAFVAAGLLVYWTEPPAAFSVLERLTPRLVYRIETDRPFVALSFDDGPHPRFTPQVLEILEQHQAQATFFLIGERALRHPDLVVRIREAGHEVGNHYFVNGTTLGHSDRDFLDYLQRTEQAIGPTHPPRLFRPPGGLAWPRQLALAQERGYRNVLGSAYPHDPLHPPVWYIEWLTVKNLAPGAIVILHDGISDPTRSLAALPAILAAGKRKGLSFVSIGALMEGAGERDE